MAAIDTNDGNFRHELRYNIRKSLPDLVLDVEPLTTSMVIATKEIDVLFVIEVNSDQQWELSFVVTRWHYFNIRNSLYFSSICPLLHCRHQESLTWLSDL